MVLPRQLARYVIHQEYDPRWIQGNRRLFVPTIDAKDAPPSRVTWQMGGSPPRFELSTALAASSFGKERGQGGRRAAEASAPDRVHGIGAQEVAEILACPLERQQRVYIAIRRDATPSVVHEARRAGRERPLARASLHMTRSRKTPLLELGPAERASSAATSFGPSPTRLSGGGVGAGEEGGAREDAAAFSPLWPPDGGVGDVRVDARVERGLRGAPGREHAAGVSPLTTGDLAGGGRVFAFAARTGWPAARAPLADAPTRGQHPWHPCSIFGPWVCS